MISIVVPLYNEESNVELIYSRLISSSSSWKESFELIFVDDGSYDNTLLLLKALAESDKRIKIIKFSRNFGHQPAITAGLKMVRGDAAVIIDGDLQDPPEQIYRLIEKWKEGYHVVYGIRKNRKESWYKRSAYNLFYRLLKMVSEIDIPLDSGDFCLIDKRVVNVLNFELTEYNRFVRGLRAYAGFRQIGIAYKRDSRAAGEAKYTFKKLVKLAFDGLLDFSTFPLRIATYLGFFIAFSSFLVGAFFILNRLFDIEIWGYSPSETPGIVSLGVGVFFLGGLVLIILGVIGEYIGRMYIEVKRRPPYIIEEVFKEKEINH
ncbi:glycosyltransferase family 2 protein [Autumnicola edwardsiae]|uniref:Glycosyltransferase family 2 protein n=1 Tax=Autumnicola edwardsiae TaxID=3075594 RepID=A0ABU3CZM3_9FLAO|nr:glycosyltransferase family 2 protein [Zunongwangia sp. F297]MDT0651340.1 glycosyltransferase family 2 protein [Zunongwangia sp. F297]